MSHAERVVQSRLSCRDRDSTVVQDLVALHKLHSHVYVTNLSVFRFTDTTMGLFNGNSLSSLHL
jgi:hypothetical protein